MLALSPIDNSYFVPEVKNDNSTYDEVVEREEVKEYWRYSKGDISSYNVSIKYQKRNQTSSP